MKEPDTPDEIFLYEEVARELKESRLRAGLMAKAFSGALGDEKLARALYIKHRVSELGREILAAEREKREGLAKEAEERQRREKGERERIVAEQRLREVAEHEALWREHWLLFSTIIVVSILIPLLTFFYQLTAIPQEIEKKAGTTRVTLPHGRG